MLIRGDARRLPLRDGCVDCVVTSPPYFALRNYGHPGQIGLEASPDDYVEMLAAVVFDELRRVLKSDGTVWLNVGDSYNSGTQFNHHSAGLTSGARYSEGARGDWPGHRPKIMGLKTKDLVGIPWMLAFALRADGWYLRSDIIWSKPNPMPESVTDRPTKAHEHLFLLSKRPRYYYDAEAIREQGTTTRPELLAFGEERPDVGFPGHSNGRRRSKKPDGWDTEPSEIRFGRNRRDVWTIPTSPYKGAHFATFPPKLVEPCVLAGTPARGGVLDPFCGAGTVGGVCKQHGRNFVGLDLSAPYLKLAQERINKEPERLL